MERQVLVTEANRMTNPQQISDSRRPPKRGFFVPEIGLSELCQKKTGFFEFFHFGETHKTLVKIGGRGGIRTPGTVSRTPDFESGAFNRSATLPFASEANRYAIAQGAANPFAGAGILPFKIRGKPADRTVEFWNTQSIVIILVVHGT